MAQVPQLPGAARPERLLFAADIAGTLVFAVEGAMAAVNGNLDLVGIMTLAFCTALGGGIIRDTLLGALPPASLRDWRYPTIVLSAAVLVSFYMPACKPFLSSISRCWTPRAWHLRHRRH